MSFPSDAHVTQVKVIDASRAVVNSLKRLKLTARALGDSKGVHLDDAPRKIPKKNEPVLAGRNEAREIVGDAKNDHLLVMSLEDVQQMAAGDLRYSKR